MTQPSPQTSSPQVRIEYAQATDPGRDPNKQINEDACGYHPSRFGHLCVLCDGMGGHYGGREASNLAIKTILEMFEQAPTHLGAAIILKTAIEEAGRRVYQLGGPPENRTRPGSTCVAILVHERGTEIAHVGDSRAFVMRAGQIYPLTRDHSIVQGMIDAGQLTEEQAIGHPDGNKITRALGMRPEVDVELRPEPLDTYPGDIFVLASDGLTDMARTHEILGATKQALNSGTLEHACNTLVKFANDRGGHDNITVQLARIIEIPPKASLTAPEASAAPHTAPMVIPTAAMQQIQDVSQPQLPSNHPQTLRSPGPDGVGATQPDGGTPRPLPATLVGGNLAPTAPDVTPAPPKGPILQTVPETPYNVGPTVTEPVPISQAWNSQRFPTTENHAPNAPAAPAVKTPLPNPGPAISASPALQSLSPYQLDGGPVALPLPPPRSGGRTLTGGGPAHLSPTLHEGAGASYGPHSSHPASKQPSTSGMVYLIIGLSAVIAVLLILLLWALLR